MDHKSEEDWCKELVTRLEQSENTYKVFDFSHVIIISAMTDVIDDSLRAIIDAMYRRTKSHCKTDEEVQIYRQRLCKLYLHYIKKGLACVDRLEPRLAKILTVQVEKPSNDITKRLAVLRKKIAERTKRLQSLLVFQNRMKTDIVLTEWVISKVDPTVREVEKDLANMVCISPNDVFMLSNLNCIKNSLQSLKLDE